MRVDTVSSTRVTYSAAHIAVPESAFTRESRPGPTVISTIKFVSKESIDGDRIDKRCVMIEES